MKKQIEAPGIETKGSSAKSLDLWFVLLFAFLAYLFVLIPPLNQIYPLRIIFALPLLLFLPGYVLIAAMFPRRVELSGIERFTRWFCNQRHRMAVPTRTHHSYPIPDNVNPYTDHFSCTAENPKGRALLSQFLSFIAVLRVAEDRREAERNRASAYYRACRLDNNSKRDASLCKDNL
jgi:hypothetical protein